MMTRTLTIAKTGLVTGLLAGLLSHSVAATEVVVVYGDEVVARVAAREAHVQSEIRRYIDAMNRDLKANMKADVERMKDRKLVLALADAPTRG